MSVSNLEVLLEGYDTEKSRYLIEGFKHGFPIESSSDFGCRAKRNSVFVEQNPDIIAPFIEQEVAAGRY